AEVTPAYEAALQKQRHRSERLRQPGAGRRFALELPERLLMGLIYLRLYVSQSLLSYLMDLDQRNISRELNDRLLPILLEVLPIPLRDAPLRHLAKQKPDPSEPEGTAATKKPRRINTLKELLEAYPELEEVLLDTTEQPLPQPKDRHKRKLYY